MNFWQGRKYRNYDEKTGKIGIWNPSPVLLIRFISRSDNLEPGHLPVRVILAICFPNNSAEISK